MFCLCVTPQLSFIFNTMHAEEKPRGFTVSFLDSEKEKNQKQ